MKDWPTEGESERPGVGFRINVALVSVLVFVGYASALWAALRWLVGWL